MPHPFEYQQPTPYQVKQIEAVRLAAKGLHDLLLSLPVGRERSLAVTKLEEVSMWANKGIVFAEADLAVGWAPPATEAADLREERDTLQGALNDAAEALIGEGHEFDQGAVADALIPHADDRFTGDLVDISRGHRAKAPTP